MQQNQADLFSGHGDHSHSRDLTLAELSCRELSCMSSAMAREIYPSSLLLNSNEEKDLLLGYSLRMKDASLSLLKIGRFLCSECYSDPYSAGHDKEDTRENFSRFLYDHAIVRPFTKGDESYLCSTSGDDEFLAVYKKQGYEYFRDAPVLLQAKSIQHKTLEILSDLSLESFSLRGWGNNAPAYASYCEARYFILMACRWIDVFIASVLKREFNQEKTFDV